MSVESEPGSGGSSPEIKKRKFEERIGIIEAQKKAREGINEGFDALLASLEQTRKGVLIALGNLSHKDPESYKYFGRALAAHLEDIKRELEEELERIQRNPS